MLGLKKKVILLILLTKIVLIKAQLPSIKWWFDLNDASFGQSAAGDIDQDGKLEVVFGCYRNDSCVYALNAEDGSLLWKYNTHPPNAEGCNDVAPLIYDVDNDGNIEVVVPSSCNPKTFCFNGIDGSLKWVCNTRGSDSPPTIADIDGDGKFEILHGEFGGYVICINAENGTVAWEIPVDLNSWIQTAPTIFKINNQYKFVVGTWNFSYNDSIYMFDASTHTKEWSYPVRDVMYHGTAVADLDNDSKPELVIGSYNDTLYCLNAENGSIKWKYKGGGAWIGAPVSIGDIDNDGLCEVVAVSGYKIVVLSNNGVLKGSYIIPDYSSAFRGVVLSDINSDNFLDIVFGTDSGKLVALSGNNLSVLLMLDLTQHYGNSNFGFDNAPLVADFNNNDTLDIFIVGGYATYPNFQNNFGRAYMIEAGMGNGPEWLMFQRDILRQSSLCNDTSTYNEGVYNTDNIVVVQYDINNSEIIIKFGKNDYENYYFCLYNILGKIITQRVITTEMTTLKIENLSDGIYLYMLSSKYNCYKGKLFK